MALRNKVTGDAILGNATTTTTSHASAIAAYNAWASELGIGSSTTILDADDNAYLLDLGFTPMIGGIEKRALLSSEGGIGLYLNAIPNTSLDNRGPMSGSGLTSVTRFYSTINPPAVVISVKYPSIDTKITSAKWGKTASAAIIYARWTLYNGTTSATSAAFRIKPNGQGVDVVCTADDGTTGAYFQTFSFDESSVSHANGGGEGTISEALPAIGVRAFSVGTVTSVSGTTTNDAGAVSGRAVRVYSRDTGQLLGKTTSSPSTGVFSITIPNVGEMQVIYLDDDSGVLYNDLINRVVP